MVSGYPAWPVKSQSWAGLASTWKGTAVYGSGGPAGHQTLLNSHPVPLSFFAFTDILPATLSFCSS